MRNHVKFAALFLALMAIYAAVSHAWRPTDETLAVEHVEHHAVTLSEADTMSIPAFSKVVRVEDFAEQRECYQ
jgi:hypothetical protein